VRDAARFPALEWAGGGAVRSAADFCRGPPAVPHDGHDQQLAPLSSAAVTEAAAALEGLGDPRRLGEAALLAAGLHKLFARRRVLRWRGLLRQPCPLGPEAPVPGAAEPDLGGLHARAEHPAAEGPALKRTESDAELAAALAMSLEPADQSDPPPPPPDKCNQLPAEDQDDADEGAARLAATGSVF
jgi:hypothetical protein